MKAVIVIPARLESKRLQRKLLLNETGKPLIQHTWEQACKTGLDVIIGTDSDEIWDACKDFGAHAIITSDTCKNGTERVAEVAKDLVDDVDVFVNVQADEPEVEPSAIHGLVNLWNDENEDRKPRMDIGSLMYETYDLEEAERGDNTKVVISCIGDSIYFSRSRIPSHSCGPWWIHVGVYAYPRECLATLVKMKPCELEARENLEQLRWMYNYHSVDMLATSKTLSINTREDYDAFVERQKVMA